ncbi:MAG: prepilin-type N-terminal cleavage/methylation domain-containing protein [Cyanobacteria bacterium SIG31]|nr:prepilin-type N-terminal cleavage/methylation domain-containing protein [Cyanobacteria bacterium SIG31]
MIKNLNKGFSLAELLIAMGIIAIISVMGITISKKGVEKAYSYYVYNAYKSLSIAFADAGKDFSQIAKILNATYTKTPSSSGGNIYDIKAKNNVSYFIDDSSQYFYDILIIVPSERWIDQNGNVQNSKSYYFVLDKDYPEYGIIPIDLLNRADLLPFTIEDGETAKFVQRISEDNSGNISTSSPSYLHILKSKRQIYSYKEAFCKTIGVYDSNRVSSVTGESPIPACTGISGIGTTNAGIKSLDPRKIY